MINAAISLKTGGEKRNPKNCFQKGFPFLVWLEAGLEAFLFFINTKVKDTLGKFFYEQTKRRPMILTTTMEV